MPGQWDALDTLCADFHVQGEVRRAMFELARVGRTKMHVDAADALIEQEAGRAGLRRTRRDGKQGRRRNGTAFRCITRQGAAF